MSSKASWKAGGTASAGLRARAGRRLLRAAPALVVAVVFAAAPVAPPPAAADDRELDLGLGYRAVRLETDLAQSFSLHGISTGLSWFEGRDVGPWLTVEAWFPMHASDGRQSFRPRAEYDGAWAVDASFLAAGRLRPAPGWRVTAGGGVHLSGIVLSGGGYETFRSLTFGLGAAVAVRRRLGEHLHVGVTATGAVDFIDLAHTGDGLGWGLLGGALAQLGWVLR